MINRLEKLCNTSLLRLNFNLLIVIGLFLFSYEKGHSTLATQELKTQVKQTPKFRASASSLHYDFKGRHPAENGLYGFEKVTYSAQTLSLTYLFTPTLNFSITGRWIRNYAQTQFLNKLYEDTNEGFGDTKVKASKSFFSGSNFSLIDFGFSLPTGTIDRKNPNALSLNYPYNMQLGSGTTDVELSLMNISNQGKNQWGTFAMGTWRMGRNSYDYRKGDEYIAKAWYTYLLSSYFNPGLWVNYWHVQRLTGADRTYGRNVFVEFYHSPRHFWDVTANSTGRIPINKNLALTTMIGRPLWQKSKNIDNVQVYAQWFVQLGLDGTF